MAGGWVLSPELGPEFVGEVEVGEFAEEFEGFLISGQGGFELGVEEAEPILLSLVDDLGPQRVPHGKTPAYCEPPHRCLML